MSLNAALALITEEYLKESRNRFAGNPLASFIRNDFRESVASVLEADERYLVKGSAGQGNWVKVPWLAVFDRLITESAQHGFYVVYLFNEDQSGIYLSLNQGVTEVRKSYGADAKHALRVRAADYLARLGKIEKDFDQGPIKLEVSETSGLGAFYEVGSICSKYYPSDAIPSDDILESDLRRMIAAYLVLSSKETLSRVSDPVEEDEDACDTEDLTKLREHKRIERNRKLAKKAKQILGFTCQACSFNFESAYGEVGREFIEAHHLVPLSELQGQKVKLNPATDFSVLCSNCHRMIHKSPFSNDLEQFKQTYIRGRVLRLVDGA